MGDYLHAEHDDGNIMRSGISKIDNMYDRDSNGSKRDSMDNGERRNFMIVDSKEDASDGGHSTDDGSCANVDGGNDCDDEGSDDSTSTDGHTNNGNI